MMAGAQALAMLVVRNKTLRNQSTELYQPQKRTNDSKDRSEGRWKARGDEVGFENFCDIKRGEP